MNPVCNVKGELKLFSAVMGFAWSPVGGGRGGKEIQEEERRRGEGGREEKQESGIFSILISPEDRAISCFPFRLH